MARVSLEAEVSPGIDRLSFFTEYLSERLRSEGGSPDVFSTEQEGVDYQVVAQKNGQALNFHANNVWSFKSESDSDLAVLYDGRTLETGLDIFSLLHTYARVMYLKEIRLRAPFNDRKPFNKLSKYVEKYVNRHQPELKTRLTLDIIDAAGRIDRKELIEIPDDIEEPEDIEELASD